MTTPNTSLASLYNKAETLQHIASQLLDENEANESPATRTQRLRSRRHLIAIREDALVIAKAAAWLLEKTSEAA